MNGYFLTHMRVVTAIKNTFELRILKEQPGWLGVLSGTPVVIHKNMQENVIEYHPTKKSFDDRIEELNNV